jgi:hypothetical protein
MIINNIYKYINLKFIQANIFLMPWFETRCFITIIFQFCPILPHVAKQLSRSSTVHYCLVICIHLSDHFVAVCACLELHYSECLIISPFMSVLKNVIFWLFVGSDCSQLQGETSGYHLPPPEACVGHWLWAYKECLFGDVAASVLFFPAWTREGQG